MFLLLSEFEYSNQPIITMLEYVRELKNATKERFLFEIVISHIVIVCSSSFVLPIRFDRFLNGWSETNEKKEKKSIAHQSVGLRECRTVGESKR